MKKRNLLRALGALVIFAVLGLLSACEAFTLYEPKEGGRIEFIDGGSDPDYEEKSFIILKVIKSSKLPDYDIEWEPVTVSATTDDGIPFGEKGNNKYTGTIRSTTTLIFTGSVEDIYDLKIYLDGICRYGDSDDLDGSDDLDEDI